MPGQFRALDTTRTATRLGMMRKTGILPRWPLWMESEFIPLSYGITSRLMTSTRPLSPFPEETHPTSIHHSASTPSARSEYKSFEEEKIKKTPTFQESIPVYNSQPNGTIHAGAGNVPAPSLRFAKQVTIETIPVNTFASDTTSDSQEISVFGWLLRYFPSRMYLYFLLGVPRLYFTRVANIFEDTNLPKDQMERLVLESASARRNPKLFSFHNEVFTNLTMSWTHFIDTLLREWKTMNLISVLLLS